MANPQIEDGHTQIANEIMDNLIRLNLSGQELRLVLLVIRKTYGFKKKEDAISLSQMAKALNIKSKIRCSQVVNGLQLKKILTVTEYINGIGKKYRFNKNYEEWTTVNKNINLLGKTNKTVNVLRKRPLRKNDSTKETITKENTKEKEIVFIPDWIDYKIWNAYLKMRRSIKKPATKEAQELIIKKLEKLKEQGQDQNEILKQSIERSWTGVFEIKKHKERNYL